MSSRWYWLVRQLTRRLWVRASLLSVLGIATALVAIVVAPYIPSELPAKIGADAVDNILDILASSLLAVTIFSLSTAVSAYSSATQSVTPRATTLLVEDSKTQNALAMFLGSFLYSLVGIIALSTGAYGSQGRVVMFVVTILLIVLIVVTLLRWIDHLSRLGTVGETTARVERATTRAMRAHVETPHLGGRPLHDPDTGIPADARPIGCSEIGYVQHVDVRALSDCAEKCAGRIFVTALPGAFVDPSRPIARVLGIDGEKTDTVRAAFTIGAARSFDQDPRFGLAVLAEIASRALSPAVNDPGTAIDVIGRAVRVLSLWGRCESTARTDVECPRVMVPPLLLGDLFDDIFSPIARDGAGLIEVQLRLQKALLALARVDARFAEQAARHARVALARAEAGLRLAEERERVSAIAATVVAAAPRNRDG